MYVVSFIILYYVQLMHTLFTNYHTPTCFATILSSHGACIQYLAMLHKYFTYSSL